MPQVVSEADVHGWVHQPTLQVADRALASGADGYRRRAGLDWLAVGAGKAEAFGVGRTARKADVLVGAVVDAVVGHAQAVGPAGRVGRRGARLAAPRLVVAVER